VVAFQLASRARREVDVEDVGEPHEVDQHVGEFVLDVTGASRLHDRLLPRG
jgi:hypothetical protein